MPKILKFLIFSWVIVYCLLDFVCSYEDHMIKYSKINNYDVSIGYVQNK